MSNCKHNFEQSQTMDGHGILSRSTCPKCIIERQAKRIEELESDNSVFKRMAKNYGDELAKIHNEDHIFTDEQIDAAVACAVACEHLPCDCDMWLLLGYLGIKRCECPNEKRIEQGTENGLACFELYCPDCNGHGWVIEGDG